MAVDVSGSVARVDVVVSSGAVRIVITVSPENNTDAPARARGGENTDLGTDIQSKQTHKKVHPCLLWQRSTLLSHVRISSKQEGGAGTCVNWVILL